MMNTVNHFHLQHLLERLKLTRILECLDQVAEEAAKEHWSYVEFLDRVLDAEMSARLERDIAMKTRLARFPFIKTLEQFDFAFQPSINETHNSSVSHRAVCGQWRECLAAWSTGSRKNASGDWLGSGCHHAGDQCRLFHGR
jgi:DNA replication protein DnaC